MDRPDHGQSIKHRSMNLYNLPDSDKNLIYRGVKDRLKINLPDASIEKDWWVVQTLRLVFDMEAGKHMVFNGKRYMRASKPIRIYM